MVATLAKRVNLGPSWQKALESEFAKPYMEELANFVMGERKTKNIYPPSPLVFNAFLQTPYEEVRVVIMGQDPYHGPGQAHGLCFSVPEGVRPPPSLVNIYKELHDDLGIPIPKTGCLLPWAQQGVLLLNATLTVEQGLAKSHYGRGWERFTNAAIRTLLNRDVIFVLWGRSAREKVQNVIEHEHARHVRVLTAPHPSPLSAHVGFFGSRPFSKINEMLDQPIDWNLKTN